ncbi:MAG: class I SAM-dependent methyltransferase [Actinomycetota bacterium]|nr:class I SAM-dependent methyltransferase [Actinomycetota bacterium]
MRAEDIGVCYPEAYFTHAVADEAEVVAAGSVRDRLRREVLRQVDGVSATPDSTGWMRAAGRVLATRAAWRRRARFGLVDPLGLPAAGARCLELGPGRGHELAHLSRIGWQATGLEVDPVAAALAQETSGCEVVAGELVDAPWPAATFDLVYASHVFEHLLDPVDALRSMWNLLRPGGRLVLVYPNSRSLCARSFGSLAVTWDPPRHLFLAPRSAVLDCLPGIGFSDVRVVSLARFAYPYAQWARERRTPMPGLARYLVPRVIRAAEVVGSAVGRDVGEELLVTATRPLR